jgi:hypothetical protein
MDSASNAANHLHGLSLIEGFKDFVLNDPKVVALSKQVVAAYKGHAVVFRDGQTSGPFIDFHWPLDLSASEIAFRFVSLPFGDAPTPSAAISAVSEALADKIGALREILAGGKLVAFGTVVGTGIEGPIGRLQWIRGGISIDVRNGDLCEGQDYRAVPKWTGLSLQLPNVPLPSNGPSSRISKIPRDQIQTKEKPLKECLAWLEAMMSNAEILPRSRDDLWAEAQLKWPKKFTERAFRKTREYAIIKTEAWAWKAPGPKPKSSHS